MRPHGRRPERYLLACLHCDAPITTTESVGDVEVALVETHLRTKHPGFLPAHVDFAYVLGQVRVKM